MYLSILIPFMCWKKNGFSVLVVLSLIIKISGGGLEIVVGDNSNDLVSGGRIGGRERFIM